MRVLVIAPQPFFTPRGTPFSVYYRTLALAELGASVDLLTYGEGADVDIPGVRLIRIPRVPFIGPVRVGPSLAKLGLDLLLAAWTVGLLVRRRYDAVDAHEESIFWCVWLRRPFGFRLVYDMHSSLPQQLTNFKFTTSRLLIGLFEWLEDRCLTRADAVITICPELADYALPRMPRQARHLLIENSVLDDVRIAGAAAAQPEEEPALPGDRPLVVYAGTFEPYQGLDLLIEGFKEARRHRPDAFLVLVGGAPAQVAEYRARAAAHGLEDHCLVSGRVSQAVARRITSRAAVVTSPRISGTNTPLKVYEQLAAGVPIVATRISSHTQVLTDAVCYLADPNPAAMADAMVAALTPGERRDGIVRSARALYQERYSRPAYIQKMQQLLGMLGAPTAMAAPDAVVGRPAKA